MAVPAEIARDVLKLELEALRPIARELGWGIIPRLGDLSVYVTMFAHNRDPYILLVLFDGYKALPPVFDFLDPVTGQIGTPHAYPKAHGDSFFHTSGPCICAPFNRKAYKAFATTGPHGEDWPFDSWPTSKANGVDWSNFSTFGDMLGAIHTRLSQPARYAGRME
jgi:hypothetical protein